MSAGTLKDFSTLHEYEAFFHACCNERERDAEALALNLGGRFRGRWLDFGCGDGRLLERVLQMAPRDPSLRLLLLDLDARYRTEAQTRLQSYNASAVASWPSATLDVILASHVLYYVQDVATWVHRAHAALAPGGIISILMGASDTAFGALWAKLFAMGGQKLPYKSVEDVEQAFGSIPHTVTNVSFNVDFADTAANRESMLRFLLGEYYARLAAYGDLLDVLDPFAAGGRVVAEHTDKLILSEKRHAN